MLPITNKRFVRASLALLIGGIVVPCSGCLAAAVTAGVVGAGAAGYAYYQGAVPRDFPATMDQTWTAAQLALTELGMPILSAERDNAVATIDTRTGDGDKVKITLEPRTARVPADGQWTRVTVRVALIGDAPVSDRILSGIDARLAPPGQPGRQVPVVVAPQAIQTTPPPLFGGQ